MPKSFACVEGLSSANRCRIANSSALKTGGSEVKFASVTTAAKIGPRTGGGDCKWSRAVHNTAITPGKRGMPYPTIIPAAIPGILCDTAAAELKGTTAIKEQNRYAELELTATCADIAREAHKVG